MWIRPVAQGARSSIRWSSTRMVCARSGTPYGMLLQAGSVSPTSYRFDQIEASVAPPRASTRTSGQSRRIRSGSGTGTQSPLSRNARTGGRPAPGRCSASSTSISASAGTEFHTVAPCASACPAQPTGSGRVVASGSTRAAPAVRAPKTSQTDRSKLSEEIPNTRSAGPSPTRSLTSRTVFRAAPCSISTPFGSPVEPEV